MNIEVISDYIKLIRTGHEFIVDALENIRQNDPYGSTMSTINYNKLKPDLLTLQDELLSHFQYKKNAFFDFLETKCSANPEDLKTIEFLRADSRDMRIKVLTFYDMHPCDMGDLKPGSVHMDFLNLYDAIVAHIKSERDFLLPILEKLKSNT